MTDADDEDDDLLRLMLLLLLMMMMMIHDDDDADDAADPTLHLLACWPAVGRQPLKFGQGPAGPRAGRVHAVGLLSSPKERGAAAPAADHQKHLKSPAFYGVFCCSHFSTLVA